MYVKHLGADVRLHRARQLLAELTGLEADYLASGAVHAEASLEVGGAPTWRVRIEHPPPAELAHLAGLAIRTARTALDDLAVSLVIASRRTPRHTRFPIVDRAHDYAAAEDLYLRRANQQARDAVRSVTPWRGGDDLLWELRLLDEADEDPAIQVACIASSLPARLPSSLLVLERAGVSGAHRLLSDGDLVLPSDGLGSPTGPVLSSDRVRLVMGVGRHVHGRVVSESVDLLVSHVQQVVSRVVDAAESR